MPADIAINLHPVNFFILSGLLQSVIVGALLLLSKTGNRRASVLIGLFIIICCLHYLWSLVIDTNLGDRIEQLFWFPYSYLLAVGPLLYLYTKSLTQRDFKLDNFSLAYFIPVAVEFLVQVYFIWQGIQENLVHYDVKGFIGFRVAELTAAAMSIFVYGRKSLEVIKLHEAAVVENFSNQRDVTLSWLFKLIKYLRVLWVFWLAFEILFILFLQYQMHFLPVYLLLYIFLGITAYSTYWIGLQAFFKAKVLVEIPAGDLPVEKYSVYSKLNVAELNNHAESINTLMQKEKLYLHETLSLRMLANRVGMEPNLVSHVLNNVVHRSFYDYVNEFRIEEVKRKIDDPAYHHLKMVEIAYECGFNSKATFNRVFKKYTGKSPSEFKKEIS